MTAQARTDCMCAPTMEHQRRLIQTTRGAFFRPHKNEWTKHDANKLTERKSLCHADVPWAPFGAALVPLVFFQHYKCTKSQPEVPPRTRIYFVKYSGTPQASQKHPLITTQDFGGCRSSDNIHKFGKDESTFLGFVGTSTFPSDVRYTISMTRL